MTVSSHTKNVETSARLLRDKLGADRARIAIILGSGLGGLADRLTNAKSVAYADLPGFPVMGVAGHAGEVTVGELSGVPVMLYRGRKHFYETDDAYPLRTMIRVVKALGIETLFVSNAAGSLRSEFQVSGLMAIADHINYMGFNPLVGPNDDEYGPRFPDMGNCWDVALRDKLHAAAREKNIPLYEGVYMAFRGPCFETPAEIRMAKAMGADAVGMSSVPDAIIARHCGLKVVGCSCFTNMGAGLSDEVLSHEHTMQNAAKGATNFENLLAAFVTRL